MQFMSQQTNKPASLPLQGDDALFTEANSGFRLLNHKPPTVLIVDDNDIVGEFLQATFQAYGYQTLVAATRDQAVEHCRREGDSIHALVADVRLGGYDGFETAQMLTKICPEMKVILISGYPYEHLVRAGLLPAEQRMGVFLQKPFLPREIMSVLQPPQHIA
jgi:CheY-like chemotaxis protein